MTAQRSGLQQLTRDERNTGLAGQLLKVKESASAYQTAIGTGDANAILAALSELAQSATKARKEMRAAVARSIRD